MSRLGAGVLLGSMATFSMRMPLLLVAISIFGVACGHSGSDGLVDTHDGLNGGFVDLRSSVPSVIQGRVSAVYAHLTTREAASLVSCTPVAPIGASLSAAVNDAISRGGAGAYCLEPGAIDQPITVPSRVVLVLTPGTYPQSASIVLQSFSGILGASAESTILSFKTGAHGANIQLSDFNDTFYIAGLTLARDSSLDQTEGDTGIRTGISSDAGTIEDVLVSNQFDGMTLRVTGMSFVRNVVVAGSLRHGIWMNNEGAPGACQWLLRDVLVANSGAYGVFVQPISSQISVENWDGFMSYANRAGGVMMARTGPFEAHALRVANSYFLNDGEAGAAAVNFQAGSGHKISNTLIENAGNGVGPGVAGMSFAAGTGISNLRNVVIRRSTGVGLVTSASSLLLHSTAIAANGVYGVTANGGYTHYIGVDFDTIRVADPADPLLSPGPVAAPPSCRPIDVSGGSWSAAVQAAVSQGGPGTYCATAGAIDQELRLPAGVVLLLAPGTYAQSAPITLAGSGAAVAGVSPGSTSLSFRTTAHGPNVLIAEGISNYRVSGLSLLRDAISQAAGDNAVSMSGLGENGMLDSLHIERQFDGLFLQGTHGGWVRNIYAAGLGRNGVVVTNAGAEDGSALHRIRDILVAGNDGWGIIFAPSSRDLTPGIVEVALGFANRAGFLVAGAAPGMVVNNLRVANSFCGNDGSNVYGAEIALQGGSGHVIVDTYSEGAGLAGIRGPDGPDVPAVFINPAVTSATLLGVTLVTSAGSGILSGGRNVVVLGSILGNNGFLALTNPTPAGVFVAGGSAFLDGNMFINSLGKQPIGVLALVPGVTMTNSYSDLNGAVLYSGP